MDGSTVIRQDYSIDMAEQMQQVLPPMDFGQGTETKLTKVWGYGGHAKDAVTGDDLSYVLNSPGPSFEVTKGLPIRVTWNNLITTSQQFAVDPTLHWANPNNIPMEVTYTPFPPGYTGAQSPAPLVPHLHGGEVPPVSDGGPDAWWTNSGIQGPGYNSAIPTSAASAVYDYPNINDPTTLWYHDHALGVTRLNVMSGLAGFYIVRNPDLDPTGDALPTGKYDMPLVFQDRSFFTDGSFNFP
ncbi:copper oxidase, partial [Candidatus Bathyarchaeota archaeon]|nr:copper oxidase [Candidatus Bathyarchaeota archaeon]